MNQQKKKNPTSKKADKDLEIIAGDAYPDGKVKVKYFYTNETKKLEIGNRKLNVEVSSNETEDRKLLHHLYQKTKSK